MAVFLLSLGILLLGYISFLRSQIFGEDDLTLVVVANLDIPKYTVIREDMLGVRKVPHLFAHPQAISQPDQIVGKISQRDIFKDEVFLPAMVLRGTQGEVRISDAIPDNLRLVSVPIGAALLEADALRPGDRVDVIASFAGEDGRSNFTKTILQQIEVVALGAVNSGGSGEDSILPSDQGLFGESSLSSEQHVVTLLVTPREAEILLFALANGRVDLTLCPPESSSFPDRSPVTWEDL
jgi:pilus assembly protein CpaB